MSKCRICECTDAEGCAAEYGCTWVQPDLCSTCADFLEMMAAYMMLAGPHDRHTIEHATTAVRRCLVEIGKANEVEPMAETCLGCHLVHANTVRPDSEQPEIDQLQDCIAAQKTAMRYLLQKIGKQVACGGCGASMYFVHHTNGKRVPYTEAGLNHFVDCPARDQFARKKE